jgi:fumarate reductase flavoprotein subunit
MPDLVVIGGGIAGWAAARRAQQLGAQVTLVEKGADTHGDSNSVRSGGRIHAAYHDPHRPPDFLYETMLKKGEGTIRPDVVRAWSDNAGRALDFLLSEGAEIQRFAEMEFLHNALWPPQSPDPEVLKSDRPWRGKGTDLLLTKMWQSFLREGGDHRPGTRAVELEVRDGRVGGVWVEKQGSPRELIEARAVVMADGGFHANRDLMARYITTAYEMHGNQQDTGDCLRMALAIGAGTTNMDGFYGSLVVRTPKGEKPAMPTSPTVMIDAGIVVDGHGERLGDEALGTEEYSIVDFRCAKEVASSRTPDNCWVVFDHAVWDSRGREPGMIGAPPPNPLLAEQGILVSAPGIKELAEKIGVDAAGLEATVMRFNRFAEEGGKIEPPRSNRPQPILEGPFHAFRVLMAIFYTMGGVLINGKAQVIGKDDRPIPGLYAAGGTMGGLEGGPHNAYAGGYSQASTFGMLAAETAVGAAQPV